MSNDTDTLRDILGRNVASALRPKTLDAADITPTRSALTAHKPRPVAPWSVLKAATPAPQGSNNNSSDNATPHTVTRRHPTLEEFALMLDEHIDHLRSRGVSNEILEPFTCELEQTVTRVA